MKIESIKLQGFKSFRGETILSFNQNITAVVGPNGVGKSNVADAFRWVLGEQSVKTLRGRESTDVIFAGTDKQSRLSRALVEVKFKMEGDVLKKGEGSHPKGDQPLALGMTEKEVGMIRSTEKSGKMSKKIVMKKHRLRTIRL